MEERDLTKFNTAHESKVINFERENGVRLPNDYREFLKKTNGGIPNKNYYVVTMDGSGGIVMLGALYGLGVKEYNGTFDLEKKNKEYKEDLPKGAVVIGHEYGSDFIYLRDEGVYLWDGAGFLTTTTEGCNQYKLAETFTEFLKKLEYNTLQ